MLEIDVQSLFLDHLKNAGLEPRSEVDCETGRIDILTNKVVYECKLVLDRASLFEALGQLQIYRLSYPSHQLSIVGLRPNGADIKESRRVISHVTKTGVAVYMGDYFDDGFVWESIQHYSSKFTNALDGLTQIRGQIVEARGDLGEK